MKIPAIILRIVLAGIPLVGCDAPGPRGRTTPDGAPPPAVTAAEETTPSPTGLRFQRGAVASDSPVASRAGVEIMRAGGNAVDAAIATSFALAVTRPYSTGLGGGGFMLVFDPSTGESTALDFRETCPRGVDPDFYVEQIPTASGYDPSMYGGRAVAVPGQVPGLMAAHERWGSLPLPTILGPAIRAASEGFPVDADHLRAVDRVRAIRAAHPDLRPTSAWVWTNLCGSGEIEVGDVLVQPALASYLERLGREGIAAWSGEKGVAPLVAGVDRAFDGVLTADDLRDYTVAWRRPLVVEDVHDGIDAIVMPPPSSGGIALAQVLRMVDRRRASFGDPVPGDPSYAELLVGAFRHAFADRARYLADPGFADVPIEDLLDLAAIDAAAERLVPGAIVPHDECGVLPPRDGQGRGTTGTSHFSVVDETGLTVACTETINGYFGSLVAIPDIGVVLNNEMNDFTTNPGESNMFGLAQSMDNLPEPGKRPLSSMSPTIIVRDGRTLMTAGASGGPRIITGTIQVILEVLHGGRGAAEAIEAGRVHHQWSPEVARIEPGRERTADHLRTVGHEVESTRSVGVVQAIVIHEDGMEPASDPRKGGSPAGW